MTTGKHRTYNIGEDPFGPGIRFGRDSRGNPEVIIPKGSPLSALDQFIKAGLVKDIQVPWLPTRFPRQCFAVDSETFKATKKEEVEATYADMLELGIAKPPYPDFDILLKAEDVFRNNNISTALSPKQQVQYHQAQTLFRYHDSGNNSVQLVDCLWDWRLGRGPHSLFDLSDMPNTLQGDSYDHFMRQIFDASKDYYKMLVVLLATRNIIKSTQVDKLAKMGIGKNKSRHWYTTTLRVGRITETIRGESVPDGTHRRPHLRRGHKRNQRFGPKFQFTKVVWIEPMFINGDETMVSTRTNYNVSKQP